jgi:kynurenine formamidase
MAMADTARDQQRADIGALGRLTAEHIVAASRLIQRGQVYDLGLELNERIPQGNPGAFTPFSLLTRATPEGTGRGSPFQYSVETIIGTLHVSTHIDAFVHVQAENAIYGGEPAASVRTDRGWSRFGIETVPPIIGRCLMLDIAALHQVAALPDGYEITVDDVTQALQQAGLAVQQGDIVLVRTGKIREFYSDADAFQQSQAGVGPSAAIWLHEQGMAVLGTDTTATEPIPFLDPARTTHRAMLVERGVHLIENVYLDDLSRDGVHEAFFVCLPLKITGATGSWVRPVAIA